MLLFTITFALVSAFCNALASVLERRASRDAPKKSLFTWKLTGYLLRHKLWLLGIGIQILAFFFKAAALANGQLSLVEPIMTLDVVFLFAILFVYYHIRLGRRELCGILLIMVGLVGFLTAASPSEGVFQFSTFSWISAVALTATFIGILIFAGRILQVRTRAALLGIATGLGFALTETFTKITLIRFYNIGFLSLFGGWEIYALFVSGIGSVVLLQNALSSGPLAISQPARMSTSLIAAIMLGVILFHDTINHSVTALVCEGIALVTLIGGIILLTGSKIFSEGQKISKDIVYR